MAKPKYKPATELTRRWARSKWDWKYEDHQGATGSGQKLGLPLEIIVDKPPFQCGCTMGYIQGHGEPVDGVVEAEYCCAYGLSYFLTFQLHEKKTKRKTEMKRDKFGNLTKDKGFITTELEDYL